MIIDSHQHFWKLERGDYAWLTEDIRPLYRDFLPSDLRPILADNSVMGTVAVQAAETEQETLYLLELARENPSIMGVVGWVDMEADDAVQRLEHLVAVGGGMLKGIRPMIQDIQDPNWILKPQLDPVFKALEKMGLTFDALVLPIHLRSLRERLSSHRGLKVMIDHAAKPYIEDGCRSAWSADLEMLSKNPNVFCKLSGLLTEAGPNWSEAAIRPYLAEIFWHFTPERVVWGSDWPVVNMASSYREWLDIALRFCERFSAAERTAIFGGNAIKFYGLDVPC